MTEYIKRRWWAMSHLSRRVCAAGAILCLCCLVVALATDTDNDGMSDAYELFYGLNPTNAADADLNYDEDSLLISEFKIHLMSHFTCYPQGMSIRLRMIQSNHLSWRLFPA
ncbi:thrombospondin type 3 repeat-containing protein [Verrucomicrobiota bacterium]